MRQNLLITVALLCIATNALAQIRGIYSLQLSRFLSELQQTIQPTEGNR